MKERSTFSKIALKQFYRAEDTGGIDYEEVLNDPGTYPYTRGNRLTGSTGGAWIERELSGEGDPTQSNKQFRYLLEKGQAGIDVIGDSPTMSWIDPDHPLVKHSVGTQGVSLCCLQDYRDLYEDIPLDAITISNSLPAPFAIAGLYTTAKETGVSPYNIRGSVIQFVLYEEDCAYASNLPLPLRLRLTADSIMFCSKEMPKFHHFLEDTYYISESGLDSVEEMALGFIEIRYVVRHLMERGADIDSFAPRIAMLVNCRMDFFEEIAKIRATRRIFARMMKEEFGAKDPRSLAIVITSHTSGLSMTAQQSFNNISRGALQCLSLALAGVQAIEISTFDEAYRTPSKEAHLVALRTQQVIQLESKVSQVTDPLGGSYFVESLTNKIEQQILKMIREIEQKGEIGELCDKGEFRNIITNAMRRYGEQIKKGEIQKIGLNVHQIPEQEDILLKEILEIKIEPLKNRIEYIRNYKKNRDNSMLKEALAELFNTTKDKEKNLQYAIIDAMQAGATMGEMTGMMRMAYNGIYDPFGMVNLPI